MMKAYGLWHEIVDRFGGPQETRERIAAKTAAYAAAGAAIVAPLNEAAQIIEKYIPQMPAGDNSLVVAAFGAATVAGLSLWEDLRHNGGVRANLRHGWDRARDMARRSPSAATIPTAQP